MQTGADVMGDPLAERLLAVAAAAFPQDPCNPRCGGVVVTVRTARRIGKTLTVTASVVVLAFFAAGFTYLDTPTSTQEVTP